MPLEVFDLIQILNAQPVMRMCVCRVFMDVDISAASCEIVEDKNDETKQRCGCSGWDCLQRLLCCFLCCGLQLRQRLLLVVLPVRVETILPPENK
jgi:hypothetical protein